MFFTSLEVRTRKNCARSVDYQGKSCFFAQTTEQLLIRTVMMTKFSNIRSRTSKQHNYEANVMRVRITFS